eukprot:1375523-Amphidinium_carterae.1
MVCRRCLVEGLDPNLDGDNGTNSPNMQLPYTKNSLWLAGHSLAAACSLVDHRQRFLPVLSLGHAAIHSASNVTTPLVLLVNKLHLRPCVCNIAVTLAFSFARAFAHSSCHPADSSRCFRARSLAIAAWPPCMLARAGELRAKV